MSHEIVTQALPPVKPILPEGKDLEAVLMGVMKNRGGVLDRIQNMMRTVPEDRQLCVSEITDHFFQPDLDIYARRVIVPAGTMVITKIHLSQHPFLVKRGHCLVLDEATGTEVELKAPYVGITQPGTRRLILILEEVEWITFHLTDKTDLEEIEKEIILDYTPSLEDNDQQELEQ